MLNNKKSEIFTGLPGAYGRVSGQSWQWTIARMNSPSVADDAVAMLQQAFALAHQRLAAMLETADATLAPLLAAQQLMLGDAELYDGAITLVNKGLAPEEAIIKVSTLLAMLLEQADSEYFRERAIDIRAVGKLILECLSGEERKAILAGVVVLAEELSPLDTAQLSEAGIAGFVTVRGGPTCHAAIIARAWGIPAVVGAPATILNITNGTPVLVDGIAGILLTHPDLQQVAVPQTTVSAEVILPRKIPVYANAGSLVELERAFTAGAEGIGLLRTEFLFQQRSTAPGEDEQVAVYSAMLRCAAGKPVVIRTLDIGADKAVPFLPLPAEANPQLGVRGIRLSLQHTDLLRTQLRALVRASAQGNLKILLPMVTMVDEVLQTRVLLEEIAVELQLTPPALGVMIEVPMAALAARELAAVSDFFSIGTNDLLQFLLAADRLHAGVGYLYTREHPAVWPLLQSVVAAAHLAGISVSVCGEWGADLEKLVQLLHIGVDTISVALGALSRVQGWFARDQVE